jgi:TrmH family RNA methyltransferase
MVATSDYYTNCYEPLTTNHKPPTSMTSISSRQHPLVKAFRELARTPDPAGARLLLDGAHLIRDAIAAGLDLETVAIASTHARAGEEYDLARTIERQGGRVVTVGAQAFAAMSPVRAPSGIAAIARRRPMQADDICRKASPLVLVAADVQDPGNVGSLIRAAEAGGVSGVLVCGASASPFSWKAVRGSMGSILRLPVAAGLDVEEAMHCVQSRGARIIAAVPRGGRDPDDVDWRGAVALVVGGEGSGLSDDTLGRTDQLVTIPMTPPVESLNVAAAAAILVFAARRQRL